MAQAVRGKQPYVIVVVDRKPLALAGLWERWREPETGNPVQTFTIITGPPMSFMAPVHNRMPVILPPGASRLWLREKEVYADDLLALLRPSPAELMRAYPSRQGSGASGTTIPTC